MPLDYVALTSFSMTAAQAQLVGGTRYHEERVLGFNMAVQGLSLPEAMLARVEEIGGRAELRQLGAMAENWDGYGAVPIDPETVKNARDVLTVLLRSAPAPEIMPNPNGTISFEWTGGAGTAHLEIGKTRYSFYVKPAGGTASVLDGDARSVPGALGTVIAAIVFAPIQSVAAVTKLIYTAGHERADF